MQRAEGKEGGRRGADEGQTVMLGTRTPASELREQAVMQRQVCGEVERLRQHVAKESPWRA